MLETSALVITSNSGNPPDALTAPISFFRLLSPLFVLPSPYTLG
jgi:hypothetical protein